LEMDGFAEQGLEESDYLRELSSQATLWRNFNRYYFNRLRELRSVNRGWGLHATELRVLREIGEAPGGVHNAYIAWKANVDRGQVSRIVDFFRQLGWIEDRSDPRDRRMKYFILTLAGRDAFGFLERRARDATEVFLSYMRSEDRTRLMAALSEVEGLLRAARH